MAVQHGHKLLLGGKVPHTLLDEVDEITEL